MADSGFSVDPAALHHLAGHLVVLSAKLDDARVTTRQVDASQFGHPKVVGAAEHFVGHWTYQAQQIGTAASDTANRLSDAARGYQAVEDDQLAAQGEGTTA